MCLGDRAYQGSVKYCQVCQVLTKYCQGSVSTIGNNLGMENSIVVNCKYKSQLEDVYLLL